MCMMLTKGVNLKKEIISDHVSSENMSETSSLKVENYNYTEELKNKSSPRYQEIEQNFTAEV